MGRSDEGAESGPGIPVDWKRTGGEADRATVDIDEERLLLEFAQWAIEIDRKLFLFHDVYRRLSAHEKATDYSAIALRLKNAMYELGRAGEIARERLG